MGKMTGRDRNGLAAVSWSKPDLAPIQSIKVDAKCTNAELLEKIKQVVCESVLALRGTSADDKYRNIVDMLMLRVRGALAATIKELEDNATELDQAALVDSITKAASDLIKEKIDPKNGLLLVDKSNLQELVDTIVQAISSAQPSRQEQSTGKTSAAAQEDNSKQLEKKQQTAEAKAEDSAPEKQKDITTVAKPEIAAKSKPVEESSITIDSIGKLQTEIDKNFKKIESLLNQPKVGGQVKIVKEKTKLEKKTSILSKALPTKQQNKQKSSVKNVLTNRQFAELVKLLAKSQALTSNLILESTAFIDKSFKQLNESLDKIYDHLTKRKIPWLAILAGISLVLIPLFWDKISGFFSWLSEKFDLSQVVENLKNSEFAKKVKGWITSFINSIDWEKHINNIVGKIWDWICEKFSNFISNPMDYISKKISTAWTAVQTWTTDIWDWVKEKLGWTKDKQDENEKKAEEVSTAKFQAAMDNLEKHTDSQIKDVQEKTQQECESTQANVAESAQSINSAVQQMQENTNEQITATTDAVNEHNDEIQNTILPGMDKELHESADKAGEKVEKRADDAIVTSENKLNGAIQELDKKLEEDGAPTSVDKKTLAKMDAEADGSNVANASIDQKIEGPKTVVQTTTEEQGKTVQLYSNKDDVERAAEENKEVNALVGNISSASGQSVTNVNQVDNRTQANIQNKILVNAPGNPVEKEAKIYEDMHVTITEVSKNSAIIENGIDTSKKLLGSLKDRVNDYFTELADLVKFIKDKPSPEQKNTAVIVASGNGQPANSAQMDKF